MSEQHLVIDVPERGSLTAIRTEPASRAAWTFVYAPGAGSNVYDPFGVYACRALADRGIESVRFQFLYMEAKRRSPDRTAGRAARSRRGAARLAALALGGVHGK